MDMLQVAIMRARSVKYQVAPKEVTKPQIPPPLLDFPQAPKPSRAKFEADVEIYRTPISDVAKIQQVVAEYYKLSIIDLKSARREFDVVTARHVAMWLCKTLTLSSYPDIGRRFHRDHTSAIHAVRRINDRMKSDALLAAQIADLQARLTLTVDAVRLI